MKETLESIKLNHKTLDDKTFRSHLFRIVAIPVVIIFLILIFSHFESMYRDGLRDDIESYDYILLNVVRLEKNYTDMETAERGYVISGQDSFLEPYRQSVVKIREIEDNLFKSIGADYYLNTLLRNSLEKFRVWKDHSETILDKYKKSGVSQQDSLIVSGKTKFDDLRTALLELRGKVIAKREESELRLETTRSFTTYLEFGITILFVIFLVFIITKQLKALTSSYRDLLKANFSAISAIEKASKSKDLFLANMSHEIRTPLGAITGFAELASQNKDLDPVTKNHISFIRRNSEHLLNLIDDLFDLSKLTADKLDIYYDNVNLVSFVDDLKNLFSSRVLDKKLAFNVIVQDEIPRVIQSDQVRFKQILSNLVGNAIKFSSMSSKVDVIFSFNSSNKELVVDVIDQGIGISDQAQKTIFEAFRQADPNHSRKYGGAGLGLSISKKLAQALSGDVLLVESKLNVGSHFRFILPVKHYTKDFVSQLKMDEQTKQLATEEFPPEIYAEKVNLSEKKILLAEDSKENQILFKIFIESAKADLTIVENGTDAVRQALNNEFDLILMDIQMPGLDGYEAVRILRSSNYQRKIIALTAHTMKGEREKCLSVGFDGYLSKPVSQGKLLRTIQHALSEQESTASV